MPFLCGVTFSVSFPPSGIPDTSDKCPKLKADGDQNDTDIDTVGDLCDNCPNKANRDQVSLLESLIFCSCFCKRRLFYTLFFTRAECKANEIEFYFNYFNQSNPNFVAFGLSIINGSNDSRKTKEM